MPSLVYSDNSGRQIILKLEKERVLIGRATDNDIVSQDLRVSRRHASVCREPGSTRWKIRDEGSSLGIWVNQKRVSETLLADGDLIRLGDSLYSFVDLDAPLESIASRAGVQAGAADGASRRAAAMVADLSEAIDAMGADPRAGELTGKLDSLRGRLSRSERARQMMQSLYEVGRIVNSSYDRGDLLELILALAARVVQAERGFLTLLDAASGAFTRRAAFNMEAGEAAGASTPRDFSTGIARSVAREGKPVVTTDAQADDRFRQLESVTDLNIRSALCVPLVNKAGGVMGVIYLDTRAAVVTFTGQEQEFMMAFADYAAIAIENASLLAGAAARARMEEELRQARKLDEIKSELIAIVSHDVRTPLTAIKSYAEILCDDLESIDPAEQRRFLEIINREADRLSRLVTNYLDLQKIEAGMMRLTLSEVEAAGLVRETLATFEGAAREKGVALVQQVEGDTPAPLRGDRDRLLQVIANLVSNAIKFTPAGGTVTVSTGGADLPGRGAAVRLAVADTGEGIPAERMDELFRRFSQVGERRPDRALGTGLGLVFSREIVELHGGRIGVTSQSGRGTTFEVLLPLAGP